MWVRQSMLRRRLITGVGLLGRPVMPARISARWMRLDRAARRAVARPIKMGALVGGSDSQKDKITLAAGFC